MTAQHQQRHYSMIYTILGLQRQRTPFRPVSYTLPISILAFSLVNLLISLLVNQTVPQPYMDEAFHLDQMQHYLDGDWTYWNGKLTTPPGVYLLNYFPVRYLKELGVSTLNACRIMNSLVYFNISLVFLVQLIIRVSPESRPLLKAIAFLLTPTLYFYNFLFYTDSAGMALLIVTAYFLTVQSSKRAFLTGLLSVLIRQTNIVWLIYICLWTFVQSKKKSFTTAPNIIGFFLKQIWADRKFIIKRYFYQFITVFLFVIFLYKNEWRVALGDKNHHQFSLHLAQMCYLPLFITITIPLNLNQLYKIAKLSLNRIWNNRNSLATFTLLCSLLILVVDNFTVAHPFILSDNRHYTFYIYKRFLANKMIALSFVPLYALSYIFMFRLMVLAKHQLLHYLFLLIFSALVLVPAGLLQFRYFTPSLLFATLLVDESERFKQDCQPSQTDMRQTVGLRMIGNSIVGTVFLCLPFGPEKSRFMF